MDIVKKNLLSIICGVVAIIAIVLIFFPLGGMFETLRKQTEESKHVGEEIANLGKQPRTWPTLSSKEEDRVPLTSFPTEATIKTAESMTKTWTETATQFLGMAIKLQRDRFQLLVNRTLPSGGNFADGVKFIEAYQKKFGQWKNPQTGEIPQEDSIYQKILFSTLPPTAEEIKLEQDKKAEQIKADKTIRIGGQETNTQEVAKLITEATAKVADKMRSDRAYSSSIYADPATCIDWNLNIAGQKAPAVEDIFDAQLTLWLQEDICRAIAEVNQAPKTKVIDAPIKRLHKLVIIHDYHVVQTAGGGGGGFGGGGEQPAVAAGPVELPANPTVKVAYNFLNNPFGHVNNEFYDVVRFDLQITCDAQSLTSTLAGLTRDRYIMIRDLKVESVDSANDAVQGFFYGPKPVVLVTIHGQYLLLRQVIKPFMPQIVVKSFLNNMSAAAGAGAPPQ